jgi:hypothetical protein
MTQGFVVLPDQGRLLDLGNFQAVVLAAGDETSGEFTVLQTQSEPSGFGLPFIVIATRRKRSSSLKASI